MPRKLFEKQGIRRRNGQLATGVTYVVYTDVAGTVLADISATSGGSAIAGSEITTEDIDGLGPSAFRFYGPTDGTDTLYLRCPADTRLGVQEIEADEDERLDALEAGGGGGGDVAAHSADTTVIHGITDTAQLATLNTAQTISGAKTFTGGQPWFDVAGTGDGRIVQDGAITSGLAVLTSATAAFATTDVGKTVWVMGAGGGGTILSSTILSRQSATQVTLAANAATTVTGAAVVWGADRSAAAETALDAAEAAGFGEVRFGPGGWIVSQRLARSDVTVSGAGMNATTLIQLPAVNGYTLNATTLSNVEVRDLTIDGNRVMQTSGAGGLIYNGCATSAVRRVRVRNTRGQGIYLLDCTDSVVEGCEVTDIGTLTPASDGTQAGISVLGTTLSARIRVLGNRVLTIRDSGIRTSASSEVAIVGNTVKTVTGIGIALGAGSARCTIDGNTVNDVGDTGIDVGNSVDSTTVGNTVIGAGGGIIGDGCSRHTCTGNTVISTTGTDLANSGSGIGFGSATMMRSIIITDNTVHLAYGSGIDVDGVSDSVIANNTVSDSSVTHTGRYGISLLASNANSQNNLITGNRCYDTRGTKRQAYGLRIAGTNAGGCRITNNHFAGNLTGAILDTAGVLNVKYGNSGATDDPLLDVTPLDVAGLVLWYAADRIPGVAHAGAVATWPDLSGYERHAVQASGGKQPILQAGALNGLPGVRFDGTADTMATTAAAFPTSTARTVIFVGKRRGYVAVHRFWALEDAGAGVYDNDTTFGWFSNEAVGIVSLGGDTTTASVVSVVLASNASASGYVNGGAATTFDPANVHSSTQALTLGNSTSAGTDYLNGELYEVVMYGSALSTDDRRTIERYLGRKWGVAVA